QKGGIHLGVVEGLDENSAPGVVALVFNRAADFAPLSFPITHGRLASEFLRQADAAIQCGPTHHFRMDEVARLASQFPYPSVRVAPEPACLVDEFDDELQVIIVRRVFQLMPPPCKIEQFPIHVQLRLRLGRIANANRPCSPVAVQFCDPVLKKPPLASNAKEDLKVVGAARRTALNESPEPVRLLDKAQLCKSTDGKRGVPYPGESVV